MLRDDIERHQSLAKDDITVFARVDMDTTDVVGIEVIDWLQWLRDWLKYKKIKDESKRTREISIEHQIPSKVDIAIDETE